MLCYTYNVKYTLLKRKYLTFGCSAQVVFAPSGGEIYYPAERQGAWIKAAFQLLHASLFLVQPLQYVRSQCNIHIFHHVGGRYIQVLQTSY